MLHVPNLLGLGGSPPTYDAQSIPDDTDLSDLCAGNMQLGVGSETAHPAPVVAPSTVATATNTNLIALPSPGSSLSAAWLVTMGAGPYAPSGYLSVPTTGGGNALLGYNTTDATHFNNVWYISGGSGNIGAGSTLTQICAVTVTAGWISCGQGAGSAGNQPFLQLTAQAVSIQNASGTAWQSLPASASDRKDLLVSTTAGVLSIIGGAPCGTAASSKTNENFTAGPPTKPAWASATPIILAEIYVPATGQTNANTITAGMLTDKSVPVSYPQTAYTTAQITGGADITLTSSPQTVLSVALGVGIWLVIGALVVEKSATASLSDVELSNSNSGSMIVAGQLAGETQLAANVGADATIPFSGVVAVSTAGTFNIQARANVTTVLAKWKTVVNALGSGSFFPGASGITAIRLQ